MLFLCSLSLFVVASRIWSSFFLTMICANREILLNHSSPPTFFWRKMILAWGVWWCLTVLFPPYFCLKALDFGRYWENSPIGWGGLTSQPGRTSETGRSLINRITSKNAEIICSWQRRASEWWNLKTTFQKKTLLSSKITFIELLPPTPIGYFYGVSRFIFMFFLVAY